MKLYLHQFSGRQNWYVRSRTKDGKRSWRSTGTSDRAEAEKIGAAILRGETSKRSVDAGMIEALLPDETSRSVFRKYMGRFHDIHRFIGEAVTAKLRSAAQKQSGFARQLTDDEKAWAGVVQNVVQGEGNGDTPKS